jgi:hypothetical protein
LIIGRRLFSGSTLREAQLTHDSEPTQILIEDGGELLIDEAILIGFPEESCASVRGRVSKILIRRTAVCRDLVGPLAMTVSHLC